MSGGFKRSAAISGKELISSLRDRLNRMPQLEDVAKGSGATLVRVLGATSDWVKVKTPADRAIDAERGNKHR